MLYFAAIFTGIISHKCSCLSATVLENCSTIGPVLGRKKIWMWQVSTVIDQNLSHSCSELGIFLFPKYLAHHRRHTVMFYIIIITLYWITYFSHFNTVNYAYATCFMFSVGIEIFVYWHISYTYSCNLFCVKQWPEDNQNVGWNMLPYTLMI